MGNFWWIFMVSGYLILQPWKSLLKSIIHSKGDVIIAVTPHVPTSRPVAQWIMNCFHVEILFVIFKPKNSSLYTGPKLSVSAWTFWHDYGPWRNIKTNKQFESNLIHMSEKISWEKADVIHFLHHRKVNSIIGFIDYMKIILLKLRWYFQFLSQNSE